MVCSQIVGVRVWEEQQLGVGVDGDVGLDAILKLADEVGHVPDLDLGFRSVPAEGVAAGVAGGSKGCKGNDVVETLKDAFVTSGNAFQLRV